MSQQITSNTTETAKPFRILSLDGGGSWAILQVLTLEEIFKDLLPEGETEIKGHFILQQFDMVVGNSGGSIVLAALCENYSLRECKALFKDEQERKNIFQKLTFRKQYFPGNFFSKFGFGPRYSASAKHQGFKKKFPVIDKMSMDELPSFVGNDDLQLLIPTFDHQQKRGKIFRSNKASKARPEINAQNSEFDKVSLVQAIHASSNAPINYFDKAALIVPEYEGKRNTYLMWDGALAGHNNPVQIAVTEALMNGVKRQQIHILSIGTGTKMQLTEETQETFNKHLKLITRNKRTIGDRFKDIGKFTGWKYFFETFVGLAQASMLEPPEWTNYASFVTLFYDELETYNKGRFIRLSPLIASFKCDESLNYNIELVKELVKLDMDLTEDKDIDLVIQCFEEWKAGRMRNQPIHDTLTANDEYICAYGHESFTDAVADFRRNFPLRPPKSINADNSVT